MFYSQEILQRRGGRFGIVWIAATRAAKLTRREYSSVNVKKTCEDIIKYITLSYPSVPRPRLSLYLSSQLMCGVTRVFEKQLVYLYKDITTFTAKIHTVVAAVDTELAFIPGLPSAETLVDIAALSLPTGPEWNPEFGSLRVQESFDLDQVPEAVYLRERQWAEIPWMDTKKEFYTITSPAKPDGMAPTQLTPLVRREWSPATPRRSFHPEFGSPHQVEHVDKITITESPMPAQAPTEGQLDLPPLDLDALVNLSKGGEELFADLGIIDGHSTEEEIALPSEPATTTISDLVQTIKDRSAVPVTADIDLPLSQLIDIDRDGVMPPLEETPAVIDERELPPATPQRKRPRSPEVTVVDETGDQTRKNRRVDIPPLELSPVTPTPTRRRRRHLPFADADIFLSKAQLKENMTTGEMTCSAPERPDPNFQTPAELFGQPGIKAMRKDPLLRLWTRNAKTEQRAIPEVDLQAPVWTVPDLRESTDTSGETPPFVREIDEQLLLPQLDVSPVPVPVDVEMEKTLREQDTRESVERAVTDVTHQSVEEYREASTLRQDVSIPDVTPQISMLYRSRESERDASLSCVLTPQKLDVEEVRLEMGELGTMAVVPEEASELESDVPAPPSSRPSESEDEVELLQKINAETAIREYTTFRTVCPLTVTRPVAAKMFMSLIVLKKTARVKVYQNKPYGEIYISRGRNWSTKDI